MFKLVRTILDKSGGSLRLLTRRPPVAPTPCDVIYRSNKLRLLRDPIPGQAL